MEAVRQASTAVRGGRVKGMVEKTAPGPRNAQHNGGRRHTTQRRNHIRHNGTTPPYVKQ